MVWKITTITEQRLCLASISRNSLIIRSEFERDL